MNETRAISLDLRYDGAPNSKHWRAWCYTEDAPVDADASGCSVQLTAREAGVYTIELGICDCNVMLRRTVTLIAVDGNSPLYVEPVGTDCYRIIWQLPEGTAEDTEITVFAWEDFSDEIPYRQVTATVRDGLVTVSTDVGTAYWFTAEVDGETYGPVTAEPLPYLPAPENLAAYADEDGRVHVTWDDAEDAVSYRVYWRWDDLSNVWNPDTEWCYASSGYDSLFLNGTLNLWVCAESGDGPGARASASIADVGGSLELTLAFDAGLAPQSNLDRTVSFGEFARMLQQVLDASGCEPLEGWRVFYQNAEDSDQPMTRREGMVATYLAAESMGERYYSYNNLNEGIRIFDEIASVDSWAFWDEMNGGDYSLFPAVYTDTLNGEGSYVNAGYFYSMRRASMSGSTIFDYDSLNKTMHPADPFSYREAVLAAIRLRDSYIEQTARPTTEADLSILAGADALREEILNSETDVTVTGTRYYVASNGSDANSGTSPGAPWATLDKVNAAYLHEGDGVFFRRGDVWRGALITQNGVTYSAYGEGAKPAIYGSPESGAGSAKWSLLSGTSNIWVFHQPIMDVGDIVVDGSMDIFDRAPVWWTGTQYVLEEAGDNHESLMAKPRFDPAKDMNNHEYFVDIDWSDLGTDYPIYVFRMVDRKGTLYLRCDEGNPGSLYASIEFCCDPKNGSVITASNAQNTVLDNLQVAYGGHAMEYYGGGGAVTNCEVCYLGAMTHTFYYDRTIYSGDGINHGTGLQVEHNYVHHVFNSGIDPGELSFDPDPNYSNYEEIQGDNLIRNNLLEYTAGIVLINWETEVNLNHIFKNITIEDNYVLYSRSAGDPTQEKGSSVLGALVFSTTESALPCANENLVISNNVFYCAQGSLIISGMSGEYLPTYSGNIYAQYEGTPFAYWLQEDGTYKPIYTCAYTDLAAFVRDVMKDESGVVLQ